MANLFQNTREFMQSLLPAPLRRNLPAAQKDDPAFQSYVQFLGLGQPIYTPRDFATLSKEGYERNPTVFRAVTLIAQSCAGIPWKLSKKGDDMRTIDEHPLLDLLAKPNLRNSGPEFFEHMISFWILAGNSYLTAVIPNPRQPPTELWCLRPDRMRVIPGQGTIWGYEYNVDGYKTFFDADTTLHLKMFSATNDWYGISPIAVAGALIDQQNEGFDWNTAILQNAGRPSGALVASGVLVNDQYERLKKILREKYTGKRNAGMPMLLEGGLDWKPFSMSPLELDWIESRKINMRDIAVALGVPSELLGDGDIKTYSNYGEARKSFYQETILPMMDRIAAKLNTWLVPMFDETLELSYDKEEIEALQEDRDELSTRILGQYGQGIITLNEVRSALGLEQLDGGDILMIGVVGKVYIPSDQLAEYVEKKLEDLMAPPAPPPAAAPVGPTNLPDTNNPTGDTADENANVGKEVSDTGQNTPTKPAAKPAAASQPAQSAVQGQPVQAAATAASAPLAKMAQHTMESRKARGRITAGSRDAAAVVFKKNLQSYYAMEQRAVVVAIKKAAFPETAYIRAEAVVKSKRQHEFVAMMMRTYRTVGTAAAMLTYERILEQVAKKPHAKAVSEPPSTAFWTTAVQNYIKTQRLPLLAGTTSTVLAMLNEVIGIGLKQKETIMQLADRAESLYQQEFDSFVERMAETETTFVYNYGAQAGAASTGVALLKEWVTMHDSHVRSDHADADGQQRAMFETYNVGGDELMHPGDDSMGASAGNTINCRCYEDYIPVTAAISADGTTEDTGASDGIADAQYEGDPDIVAANSDQADTLFEADQDAIDMAGDSPDQNAMNFAPVERPGGSSSNHVSQNGRHKFNDNHDSSSGRFGSGDGSSSPTIAKTLAEAVDILAHGHPLVLQRPDQVVTLLHELHRIALDAKAKGVQAPVYDLCNVSVPGTSLFCADNIHIPRDQMPQLKGVCIPGSPADALPKDVRGETDLGPAFHDYLVAQGHSIETTSVGAGMLRASQNQLDGVKVSAIMGYMEGGTYEETPFFVSSENYIIDGHHRWAADVGESFTTGNPVPVPIERINMPILQALQEARAFANSMGIPQVGIANAKALSKKLYALAVQVVERKVVRSSIVYRAIRNGQESIALFRSHIGEAVIEQQKTYALRNDTILRASLTGKDALVTIHIPQWIPEIQLAAHEVVFPDGQAFLIRTVTDSGQSAPTIIELEAVS